MMSRNKRYCRILCVLALFGQCLVILHASLHGWRETDIAIYETDRRFTAIYDETRSRNSVREPDANGTVVTTPHWISTGKERRGPEKLYSRELVTRFPTYMIIGFGKAGTRALYDLLRLHPSLNGPVSEERFFSLHYSKGLEAYLKSLPHPPTGGYTIEKSPDYIIHPESPDRIIESSNVLGIDPSRLKFIVMLRDPVYRAISEYLEWKVQRKKNHGKSLPPFEEMVITDELQVDSSQPFLNTSCYAAHISQWMKTFPWEQMCFVDGDIFTINPHREVHELEECMGIQHFFTEENFVFDPSRKHFCFQVSGKHCMKKSKGREHPSIRSDVVMKMKEYFQPWNEQLLELTGRRWLFLQDT